MIESREAFTLAVNFSVGRTPPTDAVSYAARYAASSTILQGRQKKETDRGKKMVDNIREWTGKSFKRRLATLIFGGSWSVVELRRNLGPYSVR